MDIKAIGFDIGQTLINYNKPLSWKSLFPAALEKVFANCQIEMTQSGLEAAIGVLSKYNTRENYREVEVSSDIIFKEIFDAYRIDYNQINTTLAKESFYGFFQADAACFDDAKQALAGLAAKNISMGFLTDVAYGMDNIYSLRDISEIRGYFAVGFTSVDIGFRKPNITGFKKLLEAFDVSPTHTMYVGDEEKDIIGANAAGIISVLINRSGEAKNWGQNFTINNLNKVFTLMGKSGNK